MYLGKSGISLRQASKKAKLARNSLMKCDIISLIFNILYDFEMAFYDIFHAKVVKIDLKCNVECHILEIVN